MSILLRDCFGATPDDFRDMRRLILPINQLALIIRTAMVDVRQFLSTDAHALSQHSNDMVKRAAQQATSLGQTAAAIKQISSTVHHTSDMTKTGAESPPPPPPLSPHH
ncbi:hypothetical protein [Castellaniella sp.]|uniref:hypothetical protein n=1 Tax=Castellaniella sp. TaxID=1955812 RepID=UPI002AFF8C32|nr:hypothetical protein [Castellaniella sp.]